MKRQSETVTATTPVSIRMVTYRGYGNEARIDKKGDVKRVYGRYRHTFYETGIVTVCLLT